MMLTEDHFASKNRVIQKAGCCPLHVSLNQNEAFPVELRGTTGYIQFVPPPVTPTPDPPARVVIKRAGHPDISLPFPPPGSATGPPLAIPVGNMEIVLEFGTLCSNAREIMISAN